MWPPQIQEVAPTTLWRDILVRVALSSIQDPPDASMIVRYILVIPTLGDTLYRRRYDYAINKRNSAGDMSTGAQEYQIAGSSIIIMSSLRKSDNHE